MAGQRVRVRVSAEWARSRPCRHSPAGRFSIGWSWYFPRCP